MYVDNSNCTFLSILGIPKIFMQEGKAFFKIINFGVYMYYFLHFNKLHIIMRSAKFQMEVCVNIAESGILCAFPMDFSYRNTCTL